MKLLHSSLTPHVIVNYVSRGSYPCFSSEIHIKHVWKKLVAQNKAHNTYFLFAFLKILERYCMFSYLTNTTKYQMRLIEKEEIYLMAIFHSIVEFFLIIHFNYMLFLTINKSLICVGSTHPKFKPLKMLHLIN